MASMLRPETIELLNNLKLAGSAAEKAKYLKSVQEICVNHERQGEVAQLVAEVLELQVETSPSVRKSLLDLCDAVIQIRATATILQLVLSCTLHFLRDTTSNTVKRAIVSAYPAYRAALVIVIDNGEEEKTELLKLWDIATAVKDEVAGLSDSTTTGVRLSAGKFLEQAILLLTAEGLPRISGLRVQPKRIPTQGDIISKSGLNDEADVLLGKLLSLIKMIGTESTNTSATMWIRTCMTLIQQRPQFLGRILSQILGLTSYVCTLEKENALRNAFVDILMTVWKSENSMAVAWKVRVKDVLVKLGFELDAISAKERQSLGKRVRDHDELDSSSHVELTGHSSNSERSEIDIHTILRVLNATSTARDAESTAALVEGLSPTLMSEIVLALLNNLPPRHMLPHDNANHDPWLEDLVAKLWFDSSREPSNSHATAESLPSMPTLVSSSSYAEKIRPLKLSFRSIEDVLSSQHTLTDQERTKFQKESVARILNSDKISDQDLKVYIISFVASNLQNAEIESTVVNYVAKNLEDHRVQNVALIWLSKLFAAAVTLENGDNLATHGNVCMLKEDMALSNVKMMHYEKVFMALAVACKEKNPSPSNRSFVLLMTSAPILPDAIWDFLRVMGNSSDDLGTLGLIALREIALSRPPNRDMAVKVALEAASSHNGSIRGKAVRLLANRLYSESSMAKTIETAARQSLATLLKTNISNGQSEEAKTQEKLFAESCELYCALCTKNVKLMGHLFEVYAESDDVARRAIILHASSLAGTLDTSPTLLEIIESSPMESFELTLVMVTVLAKSRISLLPLRTLCLKLYSKHKDPRVVVPVLSKLERNEILSLLPDLLCLPIQDLKEAIKGLVEVQSETGLQKFSAAEILGLLHTLDVSKDESLLRKLMNAIQICIADRSTFPEEALAATINQLSTRTPLPQLFMRTVLQTLAAAPKLKSFVVSVLSQLVPKQVWNDPIQWRGWIMAVQQTAPESFQTVLQLPHKVLEQSLNILSEAYLRQLANFLQSPACQVPVPPSVKEMIEARLT